MWLMRPLALIIWDWCGYPMDEQKVLLLLVKGFLHNRTNWWIPPQQNNQLQRWKESTQRWKEPEQPKMKWMNEDSNEEGNLNNQWWMTEMKTWTNQGSTPTMKRNLNTQGQPKMDEWRMNGWLQRWKDLTMVVNGWIEWQRQGFCKNTALGSVTCYKVTSNTTGGEARALGNQGVDWRTKSEFGQHFCCIGLTSSS